MLTLRRQVDARHHFFLDFVSHGSAQINQKPCLRSLERSQLMFIGYPPSQFLLKCGFIQGAYALRYIDLKYNKIDDLLEVSHLKSLVYEVDFRGNPCTKWPSYRDVLLFSMPSVMFVDGAEVTISEKVPFPDSQLSCHN